MVARVGRRPRRWERAQAALAELRHALRGARGVVVGIPAVVSACDPVAGGFAVSIELDDGTVTLHVGNAQVRAMLDGRAAARDVFALAEAVVRDDEAAEAPPS